MPATLVLHVGAPKTGSTYLQNRLRANAARLREHGIYVPVLPAVARMAGNAKLLATALSSEPTLTFKRVFPEIASTRLDPCQVLADLLEGWQRDREVAVLSAENFGPTHAAPLRELIPADVACTVVLVVRRQDRWIQSYHNQMVKVDETRADLSGFVATLCDTDGKRLCRPDWSNHYQAWRGAFGDCRVVIYDETRHDLFSAFMAAARLQAPPDLTDVESAQVSLDAHQLAYLMQLRRPIAFADFVRHRAASAEASRRLGAPPARSMLAPADRIRLRRRYETGNELLMSALGRLHDRSVLEIPAEDRNAWRLEDLYASDAYLAYHAAASEIYAAASS